MYALHAAGGILPDEVVKIKMYAPLLLLGIFLLLHFAFCNDSLNSVNSVEII